MNIQLTIGELELSLRANRNHSDWACLVKFGDTKVDVDYEHHPGQREIIRADPNDSQPGWPDSITICSLKTAESMTYEAEGVTTTINAGVDIYHLLPGSRVEQLEDAILKGMRCEAEYERKAA